MLKKIFITIAVFAVVFTAVFGASALADDSVALPHPIAPESKCPPTGCANESCHGFDNVPVPDGVSEMDCPEATCSSVECHAWDSLTTRYYQPSDMSLNLWIMAPVALIVGLVVIVRKMK